MVNYLIKKGFEYYCKLSRLFNLNNLPPLIIWEPTLACNFRCSFCGFYGPGGAKPDLKKECDINTMLKWVQELSEYSTYLIKYKPRIHFTGGEPLLKKDILSVFNALHKEKINYSITTNGYMINKRIAKSLHDTDCKEIIISIHGQEEVHNKIVGKKDAFDRVIQNIKLLRRYGLPIVINCVITDENINDLNYMCLLAKELDVDIKFQHLEFLTKEMKEYHSLVTKNLFGKDLPVKYGTTRLSDKSLTKLLKINSDLEQTEPDLFNYELNKYYKDLKWSNSKYCYSPWGTARIDPYGNVYPCIDYYFGNLTTHHFKDIWEGERARYFREQLKKHKMFPGCKRCCKL